MNSYINSIQKPQDIHTTSPTPITPGKAQSDFANALKEAIANVNEAQLISDQKTTKLAHVEINDLHDVMISAQKASITLETTVQVQKKVIDAYNEIMRMQI
ncbi:MAG TPA: flagellar hook-basal body complex protein FliE [Bacillota bacterium]|nr:flagellar hook-basal body complex protein FliE [Bacillota bacterium]